MRKVLLNYRQFTQLLNDNLQITQLMGINTQRVVQSVKFHISHQLKPYSNVKVICRWGYTCFSIFGKLQQVGEIGPKFPLS